MNSGLRPTSLHIDYSGGDVPRANSVLCRAAPSAPSAEDTSTSRDMQGLVLQYCHKLQPDAHTLHTQLHCSYRPLDHTYMMALNGTSLGLVLK